MKQKICIITGPWAKENKSVAFHCAKFLDVLLCFPYELFVIVSNHYIPRENEKLSQYKINYEYNYKVSFLNFIGYTLFILIYQLKLVKILINNNFFNKIDIFIFCFGADLLFIPALFLRIKRKSIVFRSDGIPSLALKKLPKWRRFIMSLCELINYYSANIVATEILSDFRKYPTISYKILSGNLFVESIFMIKIEKNINWRNFDIGYIGHFSYEKGIFSIAEAIKILYLQKKVLKSIFIGAGPCYSALVKFFDNLKIDNTFIPWIPKEKLPKYLSNIKLLIIASEREGLPNIMLEAMACGTPVLATPVGAIPDVIQDEVTGFIMENNTPECIARNVMRALNHPDLEAIAERGRQYVEREFTFEKAVERWQHILTKMKCY